ncbi:monocarboxylate transporter 2 [Stomoxys calcitrans]|uniref:monocarboxylate transporter 2 n=1 Tax=Stomoxys calcitrans TaxID=35570 RepID=UPI0027E3AD98|nr:monocarboxylate transporter 2 [Stomoxys calcitrans]
MEPNNKLCDSKTSNGSINTTKYHIQKDGDTYQNLPTQTITSRKKKRRDKSDLGENFVAPDGGWGWIVALASGLNSLVAYAAAQQFGIIFQGYIAELEITSSQLTMIINTQIAISELTGLVNGPVFRRFSFRQVGLMGSVLQFAGLFACAFSKSFQFFMLSYSWCYGIGRSFITAASALAVNTYFKKKRRAATSYQFGVAGLGPIVMPLLATYLLKTVGVRDTILCFAALSLNTFAGSLAFQPAQWHVKKHGNDPNALGRLNVTEKVENSSRINDSGVLQNSEHNDQDGERLGDTSSTEKENGYNYSLRLITKEQKYNNYQGTSTNTHNVGESDGDSDSGEKPKKSYITRIVIFFDLDLFRDLTYVNLVFGLTLVNFVEINFVVLTPFILSDFGFSLNQVALAMSLMGFTDLVMRFLVPPITSKMKMGNMALFAAGLLGMAIGRLFLAYTTNVYIMIAIFLWLGVSKAFRTVFWALILPGHVSLKRLPAAVGIQRVLAGTFSLACGPVIGIIRDKTSYADVLHFLNGLILLALFMWLLEYLIRKRRGEQAFGKEDCV